MNGRAKGSRNGSVQKRSAVWAGSYTVEAAVVMPLILFVLAALLICAFYVHDSGVFQSMVCETVSAGCNFITEAERKDAVEQQRAFVRESRFLGSRGIFAQASCGKAKVSAVCSAEYPVPGFAAKYLYGSSLQIRKQWEGQMTEPAKVIWLIRGAKRITDGGVK